MLRRPFLTAMAAAALTIGAGQGTACAQTQSFTPGTPSNGQASTPPVPLKDVFAALESRFGGYQIDVELFSTRNGQEYRIEWMSGEGERLSIVVDAETGRIVRVNRG